MAITINGTGNGKINNTSFSTTTGNVITTGDSGTVTEGMLNSNLYEEGTWTPAFESVTVTHTTQNGRYARIGRIVHCEFYIAVSAITMAGDYSGFNIRGLPFASDGNTNSLGTYNGCIFGYNARDSNVLDGDHNDLTTGAIISDTFLLFADEAGDYLTYNDIGNSGTRYFVGAFMYTTNS